MGIYDVNLKKTGVGYQFDHNVYIGIQTNDNRVVTFKDLDDAVATQIAAAGGGEDIELFITKSEAGSHQKFGDRISFHRDNTPYMYDIAPQYVTSPGPISTEDWSGSKVCLLKPVPTSDTDPTPIGYQIYTSNYAPASILTLNIGAASYTYNGSAGVEINFDTIPTINADSVAITTNVDNNSTNTEIPTALAVYGALALAPGIAHVVSTSVDAASAMVTSITYTGGSSRTLSYTTIAHALDDAILQWGQPVTYATVGTHTYNITLPTVNTIPTINADSVDIVTTIPENDTSTDIPTAGAVHKFASAAGSLRITEASSGYLVGVGNQPTTTTQTLAPVGSSSIKWATTAVSAGTANQWINANITGQLNHTLQVTVAGTTKTFSGSADVSWEFSNEFKINNSDQIALNAAFTHPTLVWGQPVTYATIAGATYSITLPTVSTIPTIDADSVAITTSINSASPSGAIPTDAAVLDALAWAPGISSVVSTGTAGMMTSLTYDSANHILSYTQAAAAISGQTITLGDASVTVPSLGVSHNQAAYGDHTHSTFTVFGQEYNGSSDTTISKGDGIAVSTAGVVSLDATFHDPTLEWGASKSYAVVAGDTHYITLPAVNTIPTINANSVSITTSISSGTSTAIPTEGAVSAAIAGAVPNIAAGNNITITGDGSTKTIGLNLINQWINCGNSDPNSTHMAIEGTGNISLWHGFEYQIKAGNNPIFMINSGQGTVGPALYINPNAATSSTSSLTIATNGISVATTMWVPALSASSDGTAAANKNYVDGIQLSVSGKTVTFTNAEGASISFTTASKWTDINDRPTFFPVTLDWNAPATFATLGDTTYSISLPNVSTIPTINASSIAITGTISGTTDIPTDQAVNNALTNYVTKGAFSYNASTGVLTLTI